MMIKDTFFSVPRFVNLCRKEMIESWRSNVLRIVLMYGLMAIILVWNGYFEYRRGGNGDSDPAWTFALIAFMWCLWGFGCLSASFTMERMKTKTSRLSVLMTPATSFEKFFSRWVVSTFVFLIVFLIAFKLADYTRVLVYSLAYPEIKVIASAPLSHWIGDYSNYTLCHTVGEFMAIIAGYFFFQSCFVLGSSIWPQNAFLKTFVAGILVAVVYGLILAAIGNMLFDKNTFYSFDRNFTKDEVAKILSAVCVFFILMNWTLAYFRFKESEIINRM